MGGEGERWKMGRGRGVGGEGERWKMGRGGVKGGTSGRDEEGWNEGIEVHSVQSTMMGRSQHVGRL